eukprot:5851248-Prymnesium_polylepis.1
MSDSEKARFAMAHHIEFVGKDGDGELVFVVLRSILQKAFGPQHGIFLPPPPLIEMGAAKDLTKLLFNCRIGCLAHLEDRQTFVSRLLQQGKKVIVHDSRDM